MWLQTSLPINPPIKPPKEGDEDLKSDEEPATDYDFKEGVDRDTFEDSIYDKINPRVGKYTTTSDATGGFRVLIQKYVYKISQEYA